MRLEHLELIDFRSYEQATLDLAPEGLTVVAGANGQGKTNLLEAVAWLATLSSFRGAPNEALIRIGADRAVVRAEGEREGRRLLLEAELPARGRLRVQINRQPVQRARDLLGALRVSVFTPDDLELVKGGPEERRRYLDQAAVRVRPVTASDRQEFDKALRQRNGVLKAARSNPRALKQLDVWTEQVTATGATVVVNRLQALEQLRPAIRSRYRELAATDPPEVTYQPSWIDGPAPAGRSEVADALATRLAETRARDLEAATTLAGPHRDDVAIELSGQGARLFASQGEQRSLALSLRLAERDVAADVLGEEPILLLDDVFSELDQHRRDRLGELVSTSGQTIATATSAESLPVRGGRRLVVEQGRLSEVE